jgi:hypothetical protein
MITDGGLISRHAPDMFVGWRGDSTLGRIVGLCAQDIAAWPAEGLTLDEDWDPDLPAL